MENNINKVYNTQIEKKNVQKGRVSFETMMKRVNKEFNSYPNIVLNKSEEEVDNKKNNLINPSITKKKKKISFIDEKDKTKSIKEEIQVESYKEYYIELINEDKNKGCECNIL